MVEAMTLPKTKIGRVLLPWQQKWRQDESSLKLWEKSRRVGATYTEANDAVMNRLTGRLVDYWFSSADESAAYEFSEYCRFWLRVSEQTADYFTNEIEDPDTKRTGTAFVVRLPDGQRITAMSSNPRRFRSKGGDVCLDEFGFHDDPEKMWDACSPTITWGDSIKVLSTHNGEGSLFNRFIKQGKRHTAGEAREGDMPFSIHRITIVDAIEQGIVEKINETKNTTFTRDEFLKRCRSICRSQDQFNQEFMAIPSTDSSAWLTYKLIEMCEHDDAGKPELTGNGPLYIGMDIGENKDPTIIWTIEAVGDVFWTREVLTLTDEPLRVKQEHLLSRMANPRVVRACVDATGLGTQIAQEAESTGKGEGIKFTLQTKDEIASPMQGYFEDRTIRVPGAHEIREDLHSVRMTMVSGKQRYDAASTDAGHGDYFWGCGLALHAAKQPDGDVKIWSCD